MSFFRAREGSAAPYVEPQVTAAAIDESAIMAALDLLQNRAFQKFPEGDSPLARKLTEVAHAYEQRVLDNVKTLVAISIDGNETMMMTAEMLRDMRNVQSRTQAVASAAEEMSASVQTISANAEKVVADVEQVRGTAAQSRAEADRAVSTMEGITRAVSESAARVESLAEASAQIGGIVDQIEAIAKQTNLLALNATIEAARAGEAGKGFAVVASEVKNLANQTAKATDDIRTRIEGLRTEMAAIVTSMETGAQAVEKGREVIGATGRGMHEVTAQIDTVAQLMADIASILEQQTQAASEVSNGVGQIAERTGEDVETIGRIIDVMDHTDAALSEAINRAMQADVRDLTIYVAKSDHMIWRKKLAAMVAGRMKLNPDELADHHKCRLGKWYESIQDAGIRNHPAYKALLGPHEKVHAHGIKAARLYNQGDLDGALKEIALVAMASKDVLRLLDELASRK